MIKLQTIISICFSYLFILFLKVNELSMLHKEHLLPQFSEDAQSDIVQKIEIMTADITRVSNSN